MENKKITVVTISYNAQDLIEETILSVIGQTYSNLEYIIIDGGSTDRTLEIIKKYENRITKWISEPDKGIYDAMNKGLKLATGDYVNFMNVGDVFTDNQVLQNVSPFLKETVVSGCFNRRYPNGLMKLTSPGNIRNFTTYMPICHQATFIKLSYHKHHLFDTKFKYSADYNFFYHALKNGESFNLINTIITNFRVGEGASALHYKESIFERRLAWDNSEDTIYRRLVLWHFVYKIKVIRFIKKFIKA
jgi:glycosyltransferase involved in cell wall biosynthesis